MQHHVAPADVQELEVGLQSVSMDDLLHPVFLVLLEHLFEIHDWSAWSSTFHSLSSHQRRVAATVAVTQEWVPVEMPLLTHRARGG